jgi:hypothetical protein
LRSSVVLIEENNESISVIRVSEEKRIMQSELCLDALSTVEISSVNMFLDDSETIHIEIDLTEEIVECDGSITFLI